MIRNNLRRDDEAVSAAVATVLLFGGSFPSSALCYYP